MAIDKKQVEKLMRVLDIPEHEALSIIESDKAIDHGEKQEFDLPAEKLKDAKKYIKTGTKKAPVVYRLDARERKENPTKSAIISELATFLQENSVNSCKNVEITNKERQISFKIGENSFELTLVQKRTPKK